MYQLDEVKEKLFHAITHPLFKDDDIGINENKDSLLFTYPNLIFYKQTTKSVYIKKEIIDEFNLHKYIEIMKSKTLYDDRDSNQFIKIQDVEEFYNDFYQLANEIFVFYLNQKEVFRFGCCNSFNECSDSKKCIKDDREMFLGCMYKKNLDEGKIFYGKNRTKN